MRRILIVLAAAALAGCATTSDYRYVQSDGSGYYVDGDDVVYDGAAPGYATDQTYVDGSYDDWNWNPNWNLSYYGSFGWGYGYRYDPFWAGFGWASPWYGFDAPGFWGFAPYTSVYWPYYAYRHHHHRGHDVRRDVAGIRREQAWQAGRLHRGYVQAPFGASRPTRATRDSAAVRREAVRPFPPYRGPMTSPRVDLEHRTWADRSEDVRGMPRGLPQASSGQAPQWHSAPVTIERGRSAPVLYRGTSSGGSHSTSSGYAASGHSSSHAPRGLPPRHEN
jgi:hypothetical protein